MLDILEIQLSDGNGKQRKNRTGFPHFPILSDTSGKRKCPPPLTFLPSFRFSDPYRISNLKRQALWHRRSSHGQIIALFLRDLA